MRKTPFLLITGVAVGAAVLVGSSAFAVTVAPGDVAGEVQKIPAIAVDTQSAAEGSAVRFDETVSAMAVAPLAALEVSAGAGGSQDAATEPVDETGAPADPPSTPGDDGTDNSDSGDNNSGSDDSNNSGSDDSDNSGSDDSESSNSGESDDAKPDNQDSNDESNSDD